MPKVLPAIFSYEEMKRKWLEDNPEEPYTRRKDLETGIYALDKWVVRVDDEGRVISTIGWKEHATHTVVGGLLATAKGKEIGGNNRTLQDAREPQLNQSKPLVGVFGIREGDKAKWISVAKRNGWKFPDDEAFEQAQTLLPEQVINEWSSAYPNGNWAIRTIRGKDEFAKCVYEDDVLPAWWNIVKAGISDEAWLKLKKAILSDAFPKDKTKFVKYSNLSQINKKMVLYYLKAGMSHSDRRRQSYNGILEEMLRTSNERYDIEDGS